MRIPIVLFLKTSSRWDFNLYSENAVIHYESIEIGTIYEKIEHYDLVRPRRSLSSKANRLSYLAIAHFTDFQ
jgi:hypothetical protein